MNIHEKTSVDYILTNLKDMSLREYLEQPTLREFVNLAKQGNEIAAAKVYTEVVGSNLEEAHLATAIAQAFFE
jgi:hypothetical protein